MQLLDMPSIQMNTSVQYANLACEQTWSKKINAGKAYYAAAEIETVKHGVRDAMLLHHVSPDQIPYIARDLAKYGLGIFPCIKGAASSANSFSHSRSAYVPGNDFRYTAIVCRSLSIAESYFHATYSNDDVSIGKILGFPECCCSFFKKHWDEGFHDPLFQQAESASSALKARRISEDKYQIRLRAEEESWKIISAFRYIGIRTISHFACCPECKASIEIANKWIQLGKDLSLPGLDETLEILQMPFEWDCLKGCLVVSSPAFKIFTSSVPCYPNYVVQQEGGFFPQEAPNGLSFPWNEYYRRKNHDN